MKMDRNTIPMDRVIVGGMWVNIIIMVKMVICNMDQAVPS